MRALDPGHHDRIVPTSRRKPKPTLLLSTVVAYSRDADQNMHEQNSGGRVFIYLILQVLIVQMLIVHQSFHFRNQPRKCERDLLLCRNLL